MDTTKCGSIKETPLSTHFTEQLARLQNILNLSISQTAILFNVTSKTIFDWYDFKASINPSTSTRLDILINVLKTSPPEYNLHRLKGIWKIPSLNNSFLKIFTSAPIEDLYQKLSDKLKDLDYWLTISAISTQNKYQHQGTAHFAEFD